MKDLPPLPDNSRIEIIREDDPLTLTWPVHQGRPWRMLDSLMDGAILGGLALCASAFQDNILGTGRASTSFLGATASGLGLLLLPWAALSRLVVMERFELFGVLFPTALLMLGGAYIEPWPVWILMVLTVLTLQSVARWKRHQRFLLTEEEGRLEFRKDTLIWVGTKNGMERSFSRPEIKYIPHPGHWRRFFIKAWEPSPSPPGLVTLLWKTVSPEDELWLRNVLVRWHRS